MKAVRLLLLTLVSVSVYYGIKKLYSFIQFLSQNQGLSALLKSLSSTDTASLHEGAKDAILKLGPRDFTFRADRETARLKGLAKQGKPEERLAAWEKLKSAIVLRYLARCYAQAVHDCCYVVVQVQLMHEQKMRSQQQQGDTGGLLKNMGASDQGRAFAFNLLSLNNSSPQIEVAEGPFIEASRVPPPPNYDQIYQNIEQVILESGGIALSLGSKVQQSDIVNLVNSFRKQLEKVSLLHGRRVLKALTGAVPGSLMTSHWAPLQAAIILSVDYIQECSLRVFDDIAIAQQDGGTAGVQGKTTKFVGVLPVLDTVPLVSPVVELQALYDRLANSIEFRY